MKKEPNTYLLQFASGIFQSGVLSDMGFPPETVEIARLRVVEGKSLLEISESMHIMYSSVNGRFHQFMKKLPEAIRKMNSDRKKQLAELEIKNYYVASLKGIIQRGSSFMKFVDQLQELEKHPDKMKQFAVKMVDVPDISVRLLNALHSKGIYTLGDVLNHRKNDFRLYRDFGKKSIYELQNIMDKLNITWA